MKSVYRMTIALVTFMTLAHGSQSFASPLEIRIHGLRTNQGSILINLFNSPGAWDAEAPTHISNITTLRGNDASIRMDLPPGTYAFFLFHDENSNGQLERGAFGIPNEPYAFSNNVHINFSKPSFQSLKFDVGANAAVQTIQLIMP